MKILQPKSSKLVVAFLTIIAVGMASFQMYYFSVFTVDDAYISYRYAENFASGYGLVFNHGEYVEGYTNFLWVLLLGIFKKIGVDVRVTSLALGILCSSMTLGLIFLVSGHISSKPTLSAKQKWFSEVLKTAAILYVATSPAFGIWTVAGLETPLFMCLLMSAVWFSLREETKQSFPFSAVCFGLLAFTRPEGIMYFVLSLLYNFSYRVRYQRQRIPELWKHLAIFLLFVIPHFLWRWQYYGSILPNTYYAKVGKEFYLSGVKYVYEFFNTYGGISFFFICSILLVANRIREYWVGYLLLIIGVSTLYFIAIGGDWMPEFRFFVPLLPLFFLCIQEGIREFLHLLSNEKVWLAPIGAGIVALAILGNNVWLLYKTPRIDSRVDGHVEIGKFLRENASPDDVLAAIDIGAMAYFSGLRTIDYFGLTDNHIARLAPQTYPFDPGFWGHRTFRLKSDPDYILSQNPTFIELNTANFPDRTEHTVPSDPYSDLMFRNSKFKEAYIPFYYVHGTTLFVRKRKR
jgi:arabinofuranosyltransferase